MNAVNVMHIKALSSGTAALDAFNAIDAHVTAAMWGPVGGNSSVVDVAITPLDGVSGTAHFSPSGAKWTGAASSGQFQPQVAAVIKLSTLLRGRDNRGRLYLPFITQSGLGDGSISGSVPATTGTAWNAFQTALLTASPSWELGIAAYDRKNSGAGAHFTPVSTVVCESLTATQRRRQGRVRGA